MCLSWRTSHRLQYLDEQGSFPVVGPEVLFEEVSLRLWLHTVFHGGTVRETLRKKHYHPWTINEGVEAREDYVLRSQASRPTFSGDEKTSEKRSSVTMFLETHRPKEAPETKGESMPHTLVRPSQGTQTLPNCEYLVQRHADAIDPLQLQPRQFILPVPIKNSLGWGWGGGESLVLLHRTVL